MLRQALAKRGSEPARHRLRRGARHRHVARRSDRGRRRSARCCRAGRAAGPAAADRLGQDQHRPSRRRPPGLAGLIKTVLALAARGHPAAPALHDAESRTSPGRICRSRVPTALTPWPRSERTAPRRRELVRLQRHQRARRPRGGAAASGPAAPDRGPLHCSPLSARDDAALRARRRSYRRILGDDPAATLGRPRRDRGDRPRAPLRRAGVSSPTRWRRSSATRAAVAAGELPAGAARRAIRAGERPKIAFLFTGQGRNTPAWAASSTTPNRCSVDAIDRAAADPGAARCERPLLDVLFPRRRRDSPIGADRVHAAGALRARSTRWPSCGDRGASRRSLVVGHSARRVRGGLRGRCVQPRGRPGARSPSAAG